MNLSQSMQDYLKAIFVVGRDDSASTSDLAERLGVAPASVTGMLKKLAELKLVEHRSYRGVTLTHAGRKIALEVLRHHRLIETYLAEALGYSWDEVHDEAERLEHHISEEFEDRIAKLLGDPQYDPHGDPIPTKDGRIPPVSTARLADANVGDSVTIRRVTSHDRAVLRFLTEHALVLGTTIVIANRTESGDITIKHKRSSISIPSNISRAVYVD
jgi:DtxR family Mn-dependent transcriptional regulator